MSINLKISIRKLVEFQIYFLLVVEALIGLLHFPTIIRYVLDLCLVVIVLFSIIHPRKVKIDFGWNVLNIYMKIYMVLLVLFAIIRLIPLGQIFWAVRNNFFYMFFFFACVRYLNKEDVERILNNVLKLQIFNVICGLYEYFMLHTQNDHFGGMFGIDQGCNGYLNMYLVIITSYVLVRFVEKKIGIRKTVLIILSAVLLATLGELKIFYVELMIIVLCVTLLSRHKLKAFLVIVGCIAFLIIGIQVLAVTSPESLDYLQDIDSMIEYSSRSDFGWGDIRISRLTAIAQIDEYFFKDNLFYKLFGYGLGACEDSETFAIFNSSFADQYAYLQYRNISASMNYLETGRIGLGSFVLIFALIFYITYKLLKKEIIGNIYIAVFVQMMCVMSIVLIWYNSSVRRETAYLLYFALASVFIYAKDRNRIIEYEVTNYE